MKNYVKDICKIINNRSRYCSLHDELIRQVTLDVYNTSNTKLGFMK